MANNDDRALIQPLPEEDMDYILARCSQEFETLRGASIFITGASGFVGSWLTQSLLWAQDRRNLGLRLVLLTRSSTAFAARQPGVAHHPSVHLLEGDMQSFPFPDGEVRFIIHAATTPSFSPTPVHPFATFPSDVQGTKRVLEFAKTHGTRRMLFTSSGAVYGKVPRSEQPIREDYLGAPPPSDTGSAYGQAKRISEWLCAMVAQQFGFDIAIARLFAFMGPMLPLQAGFAFGNFLRDALNGGPIRMKGDGTPLRSYLYAADLAVWLWTLLMRGTSCRPYNVGSPHAISIAALARAIADHVRPGMAIEMASTESLAGHDYVPDVQRADNELGLRAWTSLEDGIRKSRDWHTRHDKS
jgi:dTDP-glucose 4,6-dehydratase